MIKRGLWGVILSSILLLTSCSNSSEINFKDVSDKINNYNENIKVPEVDLEKYTNKLENKEMLTIDEFESLFAEYSGTNWQDGLDKELAKADIELYFKALRTNYGPYNYFGGDEAFNKAKNEVIAFIDSKDKLFKYELVDFLADKLTFVDDKHFFIGSRNTKKNIFMYLDKEDSFLKDKNGYYKVENNNKYYIKAIDGNESIEDNIKLSIDENGKLIYKLYKMIENDSLYISYVPLIRESKSSITFINEDKKESIEEVRLDVVGKSEYRSSPIYNYEVKNNIPIITMRAMIPLSNDDSINFLESAIETKNEKITIIDLRNNQGGEGLLPVMWLENRFDKIIKSNSKGLYVDRLANLPEEHIEEFKESVLYKYCSFKDIDDYFYKMDDKGDEGLVKNKNYIFVIIDHDTGSSGEYFIDLLRRVENVVVVGTNSIGTLNASVYSGLTLPNSGISFGYGGWLRVFDDELFEEGRGFMPDIIVDDDEALDKVLELIDYYNLN